VTATDLERTWTTLIPSQGGTVNKCIPLDTLLKEIKALHSDILTVELKFTGDWVEVNGRCRIVTVDGKEFPVLPSVTGTKVEISGFADLLKRVIPAAGESDTRYTLNTVLVDLEGGHIVATDGHRLHIDDIAAVAEGKKIMFPRKTALLVAKHAVSGSFEIADNWIVMDLAGGQMYSRLVEGTYPAYDQVIPKGNPIRVRFQGAELLKILEGALPLCRNDAVKITVNGRLEVATSNPDLGEYNWRMPCRSEGKGDEALTIGFNAKYVIAAVKSFTTKENDEVTLELTDKPLAACILNSKAVIMPMRI
jgi:DNA polymerase III subunit beta